MGWETTCARRPAAAAAAPSARAEPDIQRADSRSSLLSRHADVQEQGWSTRKLVLYGTLFMVGLWLSCFASLALLNAVLLRVTY